MDALTIATMKVHDPAKLDDYLQRVRPVGAKHGAEMVFQGTAQSAVCGRSEHQIVVVVRLPTTEPIAAMYADEAYRPLDRLRDEAAEMTVINT